MDVEQKMQQEQVTPESMQQQQSDDATPNEEGRHPLQDSWTLWYLCGDF